MRKDDPIKEYIRRMSRILFAIEYLGRYCSICKIDGFKFPWLLDFHHKDGTTKKYEVKNRLYGGNFANHKEEIDKCILICANCHRNEHANLNQYNTYINDILSKLNEIKIIGTGKITKNHFLTTEEMDKILKMVNDGFIMPEIAEQLHLNYGTIKAFIKRNNLDPQKRSRIRISGSIVIKMLNAKHSIRNIAEKININRETLRQFILTNIEYETFNNGVKRYRLKEKEL